MTIESTFIHAPRAGRDRRLDRRIRATLRESPCDILFIHRDAERETLEVRLKEIRGALQDINDIAVPIIPVRMTEAWLLFDPAAIRLAADNPNGRVRLSIPRVRAIEQVVDPKKQLADLLCTASEKSGRRLDQFKRDISGRVHRVAEIISDFSPLRALEAFKRFESETLKALTRYK
jgi:hypothetical protein